MAAKNNISIRERQLQAQRLAEKELAENRLEHFHKYDDGGSALVAPEELSYEEKRDLCVENTKFLDTEMVCEDCGEIIDMRSVTMEEFNMKTSVEDRMINQIKVLVNWKDKDKESLIALIKELRDINSVLLQFYRNEVINNLSNQNKGKGNNRGNGGGKNSHINLQQSNFNRR